MSTSLSKILQCFTSSVSLDSGTPVQKIGVRWGGETRTGGLERHY